MPPRVSEEPLLSRLLTLLLSAAVVLPTRSVPPERTVRGAAAPIWPVVPVTVSEAPRSTVTAEVPLRLPPVPMFSVTVEVPLPIRLFLTTPATVVEPV